VKRPWGPADAETDLTVVVTHPDHQLRGAASMLVRWGTDEADKRGIISVLQASQMGLGCYLKNGFEIVREVEMDLKPFGVDEIEIRRGMIRRPKTLA
jgi:GNAT superfamily N-acetyltransferase